MTSLDNTAILTARLCAYSGLGRKKKREKTGQDGEKQLGHVGWQRKSCFGADACRVLAQVFLLDGLLSAVDPSQLYDLPDNSADYVGTPPEPLTGDGVIYPA